MLILGIVKSQAFSRWEIAERLYSVFNITPNLEDIHRTLGELVRSGCIKSSTGTREEAFMLTYSGHRLLEALKKDYNALQLELQG